MSKRVYDIGQVCELDRWETFINGQPHDIFTRLRKEAPIYWHEEYLPFELQFGLSKKLKYLPFRYIMTIHNLNRFDISHDFFSKTMTDGCVLKTVSGPTPQYTA